MIELLSRLFVRNREKTDDPRVRLAYGTMTGIIGIVVNLLLFLGKFLVGAAVGSLAISADAFNNLSDAGSSLISFVSFRIAAKPADRDHPFGHARIEYIASMIVSFLILLVGFELASQSLDAILHPVSGEMFSTVAVAVLSASILAKLWLAYLNRRVGKMINSDVMRATAADCLSDVFSTAAVLASTVISKLTGFNPDAYVGMGVAVLIFVAGIRILNDTKNSLLGEAPVQEVVDGIQRIVAGYPAVIGMHDMVVHSYGPGHTFATFHAEVDGRDNIFDSHDVIDEIERRLREECGIICTVHMDPIVTDDGITSVLRKAVAELVAEIEPTLHIHDFRLVSGPTHSNLIFDVEVPFEFKKKNRELEEEVCRRVREMDGNYFAVVTIDRQ